MIYPDYAESKGFPYVSSTGLMSNFWPHFVFFKFHLQICHLNHEAFMFCYNGSRSNKKLY